MTMLTKAAVAATLGLGLVSAPAVRAMPLDTLAAPAAVSDGVQNVRWVCGPYRCAWRPNYFYYGPPRAYGYYGRPFYRHGYRRW